MPGILGLLFVAFVVLKNTDFIDWSWVWVTAPLWGGAAAGVLFWLLSIIFVALVAVLRSRR